MNNQQPVRVTYGTASGIYDPTTNLLRVDLDDESMTLAPEAVIDNPALLADLSADACYLVGWINAHVAHQRRVAQWLGDGTLALGQKLRGH